MIRKIKNILFVVICFVQFAINLASAQCQKSQIDTTSIVELKEFYDGKGIIFSEHYSGVRHGKKNDQTYTPKLSDVINAEQILDSAISLRFMDDSLKMGNIKKKFRKYNRQYFGQILESNDKRIVAILLDFSQENAIKQFQGWEKSFIFSTSGYFMINTRIYLINLTKQNVDNGSSLLELN